MRVPSTILAALLAVAVSGLGATSASADHRRHAGTAENPWACRGVWLPRYHAGEPDPFAYRYCPRGYYPYYNSGYWRPRHEVPKARAHFKHPRYHKAWGADRKTYRHYDWHAEHHPRHGRADW